MAKTKTKTKATSRSELARKIGGMKPGETYEIRDSNGDVFGVIGVPSDVSREQPKTDQALAARSSGESKRRSWFD